MKYLLIGRGRMGTLIQQTAQAAGDEIAAAFDRSNLDQLARLAHVNKYYLAHAFRREFNTSPINYLISRRVEESRFLLRETDHSLSLIAQMLGFSSPSYFSQCFRRVEGISPTEYRRAHLK